MNQFKVAFILTVVCGILLLSSWIYSIYDSTQKRNFEVVTGQFIRINLDATISFEYHGKQYQFKENVDIKNKDHYFIGQSIAVSFPKGQPDLAQIKRSPPNFLALASIVLIIVGGRGLLQIQRISRLKNRLFDNSEGKKFIVPVQFIKGFGYTIVGTWKDSSGTVYQFKSWSASINATVLANTNEIEVYVDPYDPKKYYLDTSFLSKK